MPKQQFKGTSGALLNSGENGLVPSHITKENIFNLTFCTMVRFGYILYSKDETPREKYLSKHGLQMQAMENNRHRAKC